jgi:hypothetical protein
MIIFPELFLTLLVTVALCFVGAASITLIVLLIRDQKGGKVW